MLRIAESTRRHALNMESGPPVQMTGGPLSFQERQMTSGPTEESTARLIEAFERARDETADATKRAWFRWIIAVFRAALKNPGP
jgi:hypothetical protein